MQLNIKWYTIILIDSLGYSQVSHHPVLYTVLELGETLYHWERDDKLYPMVHILTVHNPSKIHLTCCQKKTKKQKQFLGNSTKADLTLTTSFYKKHYRYTVPFTLYSCLWPRQNFSLQYHTMSSRQVMRINKNINWGMHSWSNTKFSKLNHRNCAANSEENCCSLTVVMNACPIVVRVNLATDATDFWGSS